MNEWRFRVGRLQDIPIAVHGSWFVVFGLVSGLFALGVLPREYPGWRPATYWTTGILTSGLFFACVLLHELGHAWVARRHAIPIRKITLFVFGGVSELGGEPTSPRAELRIALAGPVVSLLLGGLFVALEAVAHQVAVIAAPAALLTRLNFSLALFNLLPGYPLDGGRVLRAVLWRATADRWRATAIAALGGQAVALGLMGVGVVLVLRGAPGGLWPILVGWFLHVTAARSAAEAKLYRALGRGKPIERTLNQADRPISAAAWRTTTHQSN